MLPPGRRTLVTGASRPYGVALVRACLERGDRVIATCRNPARVPVLADLRAEFGGLELVPLDPADAASVAAAIPTLEEIAPSLDLLLIGPAEPGAHEKLSDGERDAQFATMSGTGLTEHYRRTAVAPVLLVRTLLPFLQRERGARVLFVSTWLGSLAGKVKGGDYASCASAAGLHMLVRALAHDVADFGVTCVIGNPGWYATSPDGPAFRIPIHESVAGLLTVTDTIPPSQSGGFFDYTGVERPW
ncbi:MAG TPA: SDR family NAD(P)-dependent oxidoreductase [Gemmatimonadaceae bacterium]|jgi:NAD(P)-dependent dehydrogenase (short-subunit alcohol dehydrogenase family)|nr:SDR family NAD(P)-dependent oxidoreductase [Gemmatimonadaceae bacterium]